MIDELPGSENQDSNTVFSTTVGDLAPSAVAASGSSSGGCTKNGKLSILYHLSVALSLRFSVTGTSLPKCQLQALVQHKHLALPGQHAESELPCHLPSLPLKGLHFQEKQVC